MAPTTKPDWSSLPEDLLAMIAKRLHSGIDKFRFRAVSHSFRSSHLPPKPLKIPHLINPKHDDNKHLLLNVSTFYAIQSSVKEQRGGNKKTWITRVEELSSGKVGRLFSLCRPENCSPDSLLPKSLNLLDYQVTEIRKVYDTEYNKNIFSRVVVSPCIDRIDGGLAIVAIRCGKLVAWRIGDIQWSSIKVKGWDMFQDIVYHNEKFYAINIKGGVVRVDPKSLKVTEVVPARMRISYSKYLLKLKSDLFYVSQGLPFFLKVYRLDEEKCEWIPVMDELKDTVLFIGCGCSFVIPAKDLYGFKRNCVYFIDAKYGVGAATLELDDNTAQRLYNTAQPDSNIFWHPPTWV